MLGTKDTTECRLCSFPAPASPSTDPPQGRGAGGGGCSTIVGSDVPLLFLDGKEGMRGQEVAPGNHIVTMRTAGPRMKPTHGEGRANRNAQ